MIIFLILAFMATVVYAGCFTDTYVINGRTVVCTTCCTQSGCMSTCSQIGG